MTLKCLKFCFLNSVVFCARTQIKVVLRVVKVSGVTSGTACPAHYGTVFSFLGSRFSGFSRVPVPGFQVFCRVPLGSHQGPSFPVFSESHYGPGSRFSGFFRVPGPGFPVCRIFECETTKMKIAKNIKKEFLCKN